MSSMKNAQICVVATPRRLSLVGGIVFAALLSVGCGDAPQPVSSPPPSATAGQPSPPSQQSPPMGGGAVEVKDPLTDKGLVELMTPPMKEMVEKVQKLQKEYDAKPADAKVKSELVAAKLEYGNAWMFGDSLPQRVKYRVALKMYRQVLELDPKNEKAIESRKQIEDIYKQLGRPVPE